MAQDPFEEDHLRGVGLDHHSDIEEGFLVEVLPGKENGSVEIEDHYRVLGLLIVEIH